VNFLIATYQAIIEDPPPPPFFFLGGRSLFACNCTTMLLIYRDFRMDLYRKGNPMASLVHSYMYMYVKCCSCCHVV